MIDESLTREAAFHDDRFAGAGHERGNTGVFYRTSAASRRAYLSRIERYAAGARLLEFGCGPGGTAFRIAPIAGAVTGIDISPVAVNRAQLRAQTEGFTNASFAVRDAQATGFADSSFDVVYGTGILHHLALDAAFREIARLLSANGRAVFLEPLGHNALINCFRKLTPSLRTVDEHPLLIDDLRQAQRHFAVVDVNFHHCTSLAAAVLAKTPLFERAVDMLNGFDRTVFERVPSLRRYAWIAVMEFREPLRAAHEFTN